jgi:PAS domain S-box-containing protein
MKTEIDSAADEVKRLNACMGDLTTILALPAIWIGSESSQIVSSLLDALLRTLRLDFVYARLGGKHDEPPSEMVRAAQRQGAKLQAQEVGRALDPWLIRDLPVGSLEVPSPVGEGTVSIARFGLGLHDDTGILVVGSARADFPSKTDMLLLRVAVNQAVIGLQEARLLETQQRAAAELERRIAQRTAQLTIANEALRTSEERFRRYFELGLIGMAMTSPAKGILEVNDELCRMLGYERYELLKKDWAELTHPEDLAADVAQFNRVLAGDFDSYTLEKRWIRKNGQVIDSIMSAKCLRNADGSVNYFVGLVEDITERKRAEEALRATQAQLAHIARVTTMGELAASIAHEVNQPLTAVVTNGDAGLRWLSQVPPNVDEARMAMREMVRQGHRASDVIARIRALLRKAPPQFSDVGLNQLIVEVLLLTHRQLAGNRVAVRTELAADMPPVSGDSIQLQQVLVNLILNAIEAANGTKDGPRELLLKTQRAGPNDVVVAVQDSGAGIDPQHMDRLFRPFFTTKATGMGMGLAISRSIIEAHGGRLWATSNGSHGATFQFSLPVQSAE